MDERPFYKYYKDEQSEKTASKIFVRFICFAIVIYAVLFGINYYFNANYTYITINGISMQPTLNPDPYLLVKTVNGIRKSDYVQDGVYIRETQDIDYNDIIIIANIFADKTIIKRALAFDGDYITIARIETDDGQNEYRFMRVKENTSTVEVVEEEYIKSYQVWSNAYTVSQSQRPQDPSTAEIVYEPLFFNSFYNKGYESRLFSVHEADGEQVRFFKVPDGQFFYMGDNRTNSTDGREKGTTKVDNIVGKVVKIVSNGTDYPGNNFWWLNRLGGLISVLWDDILRFFGANI
ncbi:MAG: signal peptidase I [Clostridia bacterium]|nr:signal peptidase I [Clostridia bacterium]